MKGKTSVQMMNFVIKMMDSVLKMMDFALKMVRFVLKMTNLHFKTHLCAYDGHEEVDHQVRH